MTETFVELLTRLSADNSLFNNVEEAIRQGVVLPILAHLEWNTYNIYEVIPEFSVGEH
jgi:predicted type IV restriction endonuclease